MTDRERFEPWTESHIAQLCDIDGIALPIEFLEWVTAVANRAANEAAAETGALIMLIQDMAKQKPEKPDHWNSCGQCERNIEQAQDLLAARATPAEPDGDARNEIIEQCARVADEMVLYTGYDAAQRIRALAQK
jgi:hypothetical protein